MKDNRLLTPEDFCDIDEAILHVKALRKLLRRLSVSGPFGFGLAAQDLLYYLNRDLPWLECEIANDIEASRSAA